jgi:hypothetical protein
MDKINHDVARAPTEQGRQQVTDFFATEAGYV